MGQVRGHGNIQVMSEQSKLGDAWIGDVPT